MHPRPPQQHNVFFRLLIPLSALFVVTILALVACVFSTSPSRIHRFLAEQGGLLITIEVTSILLVAAIAMVVDRIQILRSLNQAGRPDQPAPRPETGRSAEQAPAAGPTNSSNHEQLDVPAESVLPTDSSKPCENR